MSNEELAIQIQAGNRDLMPELWEKVERFVTMKAYKIPLNGDTVERKDLLQAGYLALESAVADYDSEGGYAFLTCLGYHLKTQFAIATRFRSERQKRETLAGALSLDAPVNDEGNASTLMYFQEDLSGAEALESVEEKIYQAQLRETMEMALEAIPPQSRDVLRLRYYQGQTLAEIAEAQGTTPERVRQKESKALRQLRKPSIACHLRPFHDFDFYCGTGLGAFQHSGMSIQERYLVLEEEARERRQERAHREQEKQIRKEYNETISQIQEEAEARVSRMTPEKKRALLEKHGYA